MPVLIRLAILVALVAALGAVFGAVRLSSHLRRARRVSRNLAPDVAAGERTILYFTADYCTVCRYRQRPALDALVGRLGPVRVVEVDAPSEVALARRFGVLSLPTTAVLSPDGTVVAVNYGYASAAQLEEQLQSILPA